MSLIAEGSCCIFLMQVKRQLNIQLHEQNVRLEQPLSTVGEFEVPLVFPRSVRLPGGREELRLEVKIRRV